MARKHKLSGDFIPEYTVIGLSSLARGYRLAMKVNEKLGLKLRRVADYPGRGPDQPLLYSLYYYNDRELRRNYILLYNRNPEGMLVPQLKGIDAFLVLHERLSSAESGAMLNTLRQGPGIQAAYEINISAVKDFDLLMQDLEVFITDTNQPGESEI